MKTWKYTLCTNEGGQKVTSQCLVDFSHLHPPVSVSYFQSGGFIPLSASVGMTVYWLQCCGSVRLTVRLTYLRAISLTLKHVGHSKWWCWKGCGSPLTAIDSWEKTISFTAEIKRMYYDVWRSCSAVLWLTCQVSDADSADWIPC